MSTPAVVSLEGVSKIYGSGEAAVAALRSVDLAVKTGEYVFKDNMTPEAVLNVLIAGVKQETVSAPTPAPIRYGTPYRMGLL